MAEPLRVGIAGGGTGGHIEPALNLADELRRRDPDTHIAAFGTERGLEVDLVPARGYELHLIPPVPMPRKPSKDLLSVPGRMRAAVRAARDIIRTERLDVVVGFGGYVSTPAYAAARREKIPFVVHEANAKPGLANRLGARFTRFVAENYTGSLPHATRVGCPLRQAIATLDRSAQRAEARDFFDLPADGPALLVFGGSQGAASINTAVWDSAARLTQTGVRILHAVGPRQHGQAPQLPGYRAVPYIDRMDLAYAAADLALCRAGAMTCAELAAVGLPALYIPYPIGNGEQRFNAQPVVSAGGGLIMGDRDLDGPSLLAQVEPLLGDPGRLRAMSDRATGYGIRDGAGRLADMVATACGRTP